MFDNNFISWTCGRCHSVSSVFFVFFFQIRVVLAREHSLGVTQLLDDLLGKEPNEVREGSMSPKPQEEARCSKKLQQKCSI